MMELTFKKYFWLVPLVVTAISSVLAATATNHFIEGKYLLGEGSAGPRAKAVPQPRLGKPVDKQKIGGKDGAAVVARNMFCSTCEPAAPVAPSAPVAAPSDPNHPPATSLPLALLATAVAHREVLSSATIANTQSSRQGAYWLHEDIPDAGEIVRISSRFVDFNNRSMNRVERLDLLGLAAAGGPRPAAPAPPPPGGPPPAGPEGEFMSEVEAGVKKIDETHYEIERGVVDKALADPTIIARAARIVPSVKDGKPDGFKMYAIRPNSVYAKIGFQNGDTIHSINGFDMTSPDKALEVYTKVKSATSLSITVTRRGQPVNLDYRIK